MKPKKKVEDKPLPKALLKAYMSDKSTVPKKKRMPNGDMKKGNK